MNQIISNRQYTQQNQGSEGVVAKQGLIACELKSLENQAEELCLQVEKLLSKLQPIVIDRPSNPKDSKNPSEVMLPSMGEKLRNIRYKLVGLGEAISHFNDMIEI